MRTFICIYMYIYVYLYNDTYICIVYGGIHDLRNSVAFKMEYVPEGTVAPTRMH